jgi:hypothetical protein
MSWNPTEKEVVDAVNGVAEVLIPCEPDLQDFVLAEALATFIARHVVPGDAAETRVMQEEILAAHIEGVRKMIPVRVADVERCAGRGVLH